MTEDPDVDVVDRDRARTALEALAVDLGRALDDPAMDALTAHVADVLDGTAEPSTAEQIARLEEWVTTSVLGQVPDATAWTVRAAQWEHGWYLSSANVQVTTATGTQRVITLVGLDDGDLADLTPLIGGAGPRTTHRHTIPAHRLAGGAPRPAG